MPTVSAEPPARSSHGTSHVVTAWQRHRLTGPLHEAGTVRDGTRERQAATTSTAKCLFDHDFRRNVDRAQGNNVRTSEG